MTILPEDTVATAEALLRLVKSLVEPTIDPESQYVYDTKVKIQNECDRLLRNVMGPLEYTVVLAESCQESQALHLITSLGIPDMIGEDSATLSELSVEAAVDARVLGVAMSCLLGRGYFEEVHGYGSRIYRNNALSAVLREDHPTSLKSAVGLSGDEAFRATSRLLDAAKSGVKQESQDRKNLLTGANIAFGFQSSIFKWMALPENLWRAQRVGSAMKQYHSMANTNVPKDYPWHKLTSPIVDCGGGIGSMEMNVLSVPSNSHLEFILLDLPSTVENAKKIWSHQPASKASQVTFVGGDFTASTLEETKIPQGRPTYMIAHVLHDWTDAEVVQILRNVRAAMCASSSDGDLAGKRLLVCEMLLRPESSRFVRETSMQLLALSNGITRTQAEFEALLLQAGFKVTFVHHMRAVDSIIEAVPVL